MKEFKIACEVTDSYVTGCTPTTQTMIVLTTQGEVVLEKGEQYVVKFMKIEPPPAPAT